jgi:hypothetical protein
LGIAGSRTVAAHCDSGTGLRTFVATIMPFTQEPLLENAATFTSPHLKNRRTDLVPPPQGHFADACEALGVVGERAIVLTPRGHQQQEVRSVLLSGEMHSVRDVGIDEQRNVGRLSLPPGTHSELPSERQSRSKIAGTKRPMGTAFPSG